MKAPNANTQRRWLLGLALALTLVAVIFAPQPDDSGVVLSAHASQGKNKTAAAVSTGATEKTVAEISLQVQPLSTRIPAPADASLFVTPPQPKPVAPVAAFVAPPPPEEPPLPPYTVMGRYNSDKAQLVLLSSGKDTLQVQEGDSVANGWRIKQISESSIVFVSPAGKEQLLQTEDNP